MWVLDYLDDIDSDMSVFHRVDDAHATLPAAVYFARAERLPAYRGVMRARVLDEQTRSNGTSATPGRVVVDEGIALAQLAQSGWLEHTTEGSPE